MLFDDSVRLAFWIGAVSTLATLMLLAGIVWMRVLLLAQRRRRDAFVRGWQPVLVATVSGDQVPRPVLHPSEINNFLMLWVRMQKTVRGLASERLKLLLMELGLEDQILRVLQRGRRDERLLCITASGYLGSGRALPHLERLLQHPLAAISITAANAMIRVDVHRAAELVIPLMVQHRDWTVDRAAVMLQDAESAFVEAFIEQVTRDEQHSQPQVLRFMRILAAVHLNRALPFVRHILQASDKPELVATALTLVRLPADLDLVRQRAADTHWFVQVQALTVLGRMGEVQDVSLLVAHLRSPHWWVRYRAATSLLQLPFLSRAEFETLRGQQEDPFARDILTQALAEHSGTSVGTLAS